MKDFLKKSIAVMLLAGMLLSLAGCGVFSLSEEDITELEQDDVQVVTGQSIGQQLAGTYAADHIFSLNSVSSSSFNPYLTTSAWNKVVGMLVYETLVTEDETFSAQPNLIKSWETEDGINWTFTVDSTRTFHDGGAMSGVDAVYSIQYAMGVYNLASTQYKDRFRDVEISGFTWWQDTFTVKLERANYRFYELLNIPCIEYNSGFQSYPPGTGPYAFSESGNYLVLDRNHPMAGEMTLDTIYLKEYSAAVDILQAFEDSYLDLVINDPNSMSSLGYSSTNIIKYIDTTSLHYLGYNMYSGVFNQSQYRAIMTYAIDRANIVSDVMQGAAVAATLPIHPSSPLYPEAYAQTLSYSKKDFESALESVGAADLDRDGFLEFGGLRYVVDFIVCSESAVKVSAARTIERSMRDCGIDVNLRELSFEDYQKALETGDYDMFYAEVRLCADWDLELLVGMGGSLNYGGVHDATLDTYMRSALASQGELQQANAQKLYEYIGQSAPITAICFERSQVLYHRGVLSGLSPTQDNIFNNLQDWKIDLS